MSQPTPPTEAERLLLALLPADPESTHLEHPGECYRCGAYLPRHEGACDWDAARRYLIARGMLQA